MPAAPNPFVKATKKQAWARIAFTGPTGAGKTWTGLMVASELAASEGKRPAGIDTETGSMSLYADEFDFDVLEIHPPYSPSKYVEAIRAASAAGYGAVLIDSLSHGWEAEGGVLDIVDSNALSGNRWSGWKVGTPAQNALVTAMLGTPIHVVATMRSTMETAMQEVDGRKQVVRLGMKPRQRDGIEYEFTLVADMDTAHMMTVTKSRAKAFADRRIHKPGPSFAQEFASWLRNGEPLARPRQQELLNDAWKALPVDARTATAEWMEAERMSFRTLTEAQAAALLEHLGVSEGPEPPDRKQEFAVPPEREEVPGPEVEGDGSGEPLPMFDPEHPESEFEDGPTAPVDTWETVLASSELSAGDVEALVVKLAGEFGFDVPPSGDSDDLTDWLSRLDGGLASIVFEELRSATV